MEKTALILGITGGFGNASAHALLKDGWTVRALHRNPAKARELFSTPDEIEWIEGDAMSADGVRGAAEGVGIIVHAVNPPGYKNWRGLALPMLDNSIKAARATGARLVFPGNVYNFGPDAGSNVDEGAPQNPETRKGKIRVEMEASLKSACENGMKALIVRAGDYFGPHTPGSWFTGVMVKAGRPVSKVIYPGVHDVGHAWAYLPDMADTVVRLLAREESLDPFAQFHFRGHALSRGVEMAETVARVAGGGGRNVPVRPLPWPLLYLLAPFIETFREIIEMRYLWKIPLQLDNTKLTNLLGEEPHTPLEDAVSATLEAMGCLKP